MLPIRYYAILSLLPMGVMTETACAWSWSNQSIHNHSHSHGKWITGSVVLAGLGIGWMYWQWRKTQVSITKNHVVLRPICKDPSPVRDDRNGGSSRAPYDFDSDLSRKKLQEDLTKIVDSYQGGWLIPVVADIAWDYALDLYHSSTFTVMPNSYLTHRYYIYANYYMDYDDHEAILTLKDAATDTIMNAPQLRKTWENRPVAISQDETQMAFVLGTQLCVKKLCHANNNHPYLEDSLCNTQCEDHLTHIYFLSNDTLAVLDDYYTMSIFKISQLNGNNHTLELQKKIAFKQVINSLFKSTLKIVHILDNQHLLIAQVVGNGIPQASIINATDFKVVRQFSYPSTNMINSGKVPGLIRVISGKRVVYLGEPYLQPMYITQLSDDCRSIMGQSIIELPKYTIAQDVSYFGDYVALQQPQETNEPRSFELQPIKCLNATKLTIW